MSCSARISLFVEYTWCLMRLILASFSYIEDIAVEYVLLWDGGRKLSWRLSIYRWQATRYIQTRCIRLASETSRTDLNRQFRDVKLDHREYLHQIFHSAIYKSWWDNFHFQFNCVGCTPWLQRGCGDVNHSSYGGMGIDVNHSCWGGVGMCSIVPKGAWDVHHSC